MSIYDELRTEFSDWRDAYFDDQRRSRIFADNFLKLYAQYIGAPVSYRADFSDEPELNPYIFPCSVTLNDEDASFSARMESSVISALSSAPDHRWYFAIGTTFEVALNTYPKQWFPQLLSFHLDDDVVHLRVTSNPEGVFTLSANDASTFTAAYDYMVMLHKRELSKRRKDLVSPPRRYGFIEPKPLADQVRPAVDPYSQYFSD